MRGLIRSILILATTIAVSGTGIPGGSVAQTNCEFDCVDRLSLMTNPSIKDVCAELYKFLSAEYQSCKTTINNVEATEGGTPGRTEADQQSSWCSALCASSTPPTPKKTCVQTCVDKFIGDSLSSGKFCFENGKVGSDYFDCTSTLFAIDLANPWFALDKESRLEAWCGAIVCDVTSAPSTLPPTSSPTGTPTMLPTGTPTIHSTDSPTRSKTSAPSAATTAPTASETSAPTAVETSTSETSAPTAVETSAQTAAETSAPTSVNGSTSSPTMHSTSTDKPKGPYPEVRQSSCVNQCANYWVNQPRIRIGSFCDFSGWKGSFLDSCALELKKMDVTKKNTKKKFAKAWCRLITCKYNPL